MDGYIGSVRTAISPVESDEYDGWEKDEGMGVWKYLDIGQTWDEVRRAEHVRGAWAEQKWSGVIGKIERAWTKRWVGLSENDWAGAELGAEGHGAGGERSNLIFYWFHKVYSRTPHFAAYSLLFALYYLVIVFNSLKPTRFDFQI